jgi:membrane protein DedA with SNARE-associated domain
MKDFVISAMEFLAQLGYLGIALALMVEIIPSEIVLGYGGYMISQGHINFIGAIIAGTIGGTIAQLFLYWAGYYGGRPFLKKYGKYVLIKESHIDLSEQWFIKYGAGVVFFARFLPVVRQAISIPAGIAKMSISKFTLYTVAATVPWVIMFLYLGKVLGSNWTSIKEYAQPYVMPIIIAAIVLAAIYILIKRTRKTTD